MPSARFAVVSRIRETAGTPLIWKVLSDDSGAFRVIPKGQRSGRRADMRDAQGDPRSPGRCAEVQLEGRPARGAPDARRGRSCRRPFRRRRLPATWCRAAGKPARWRLRSMDDPIQIASRALDQKCGQRSNGRPANK